MSSATNTSGSSASTLPHAAPAPSSDRSEGISHEVCDARLAMLAHELRSRLQVLRVAIDQAELAMSADGGEASAQAQLQAIVARQRRAITTSGTVVANLFSNGVYALHYAQHARGNRWSRARRPPHNGARS